MDGELSERERDMVRGLATKIAKELGLQRELDELIACGFHGLLEAKVRFDPSRGTPIEGFVYHRVRGAILDGVRQLRDLPRQAWEQSNRITITDEYSEAVAEGELERGDPPTDEASALEKISQFMAHVTASYVLTEQLDAVRRGNPERAVITELERARARKIIGELPEKERIAILMTYFEHQPLDAVAARLGVSRAQASRYHTSGLEILRKRWRDASEDLL